MSKSRLGIGFIALAFALMLSGGLLGQDKKEAPAPKGQLPAQWKKLSLSDEQIKKIYSVQTDYRGKIAELEDKVKELRKQERADLEKVLTDGQKTRLKEILLEKAPGESKEDKKPASKEEKKSESKEEKKSDK